jgi:hypothetical protein
MIPLTEEEVSLPRIGYKAAGKLKREFQTDFIHSGQKYLFSFVKIDITEEVHIEGIPFRVAFKNEEQLDPQNSAHITIIKKVISYQLGKIMSKMGYTMRDRNILYKPEFDDSDNIESHPAIEYQIQLSPLGRVLIFIDVKRRWIAPLDKLLSSMGDIPFSEKVKTLKGKEVMVHYTDDKLFSKKIVDIIDVKHINHHLEIEGDPPIYDYWATPFLKDRPRIEAVKRKLKYEPNEEDHGVAILGDDLRTSDYPIQVLRLKIDLHDPEICNLLDLDAQKARLSPDQRKDRIAKVAKAISDFTFHIYEEDISFNNGSNSNEIISVGYLKSDGYEIYQYDIPALEFNNGYQHIFQKGQVNSALRNAGPYSGTKDLTIDIVWPSERRPPQLEYLFSNLERQYRSFNLGKLSLGEIIEVPSDSAPYGAKAIEFYYDLQDSGVDLNKRFVIGVLPNHDPDGCHHSLNNELKALNIPSKCIRIQNVYGFKQYRGPHHIFNIIASIYERSLSSGEAMWILSKKAGTLQGDLSEQLSENQKKKERADYTTIYVGFDISRIKGKSEVASYASICEPHGRLISAKDMSFHGEVLYEDDLRKIINNVLRDYEKQKRQMGLKKVDEIVFFKDGTSRGPMARDAIEKGLELVRDDLINSDRASSNLVVNYVTVTKNIIHRIFDSGKLPEGVCIVNNEYSEPQAIILTTTPMGNTTTQSPNLITLHTQIGEEDKTAIYRIAKEYFDLRFLHWETWMVQPGTAIPLHVVQHKAKQLAYGYDTTYVPK